MSVTHGHRTLAAIVLTDAVGFSARMAVHEESTLSQIQRDQELMEKLCQDFEGKVLKSTGDGLLMYFASAVQAVSCGLAIQQKLARTDDTRDGEPALLHRIGIHLGDVFFSQSDVMGNGVNIAARLQTEAHPSGLCISKLVYDVVKSRLDLDVTYAGPLQLKNIQELVPAYHVHALPRGHREVNPTAAIAADAHEPTTAHELANTHEPAAEPKDRQIFAPGSKIGGRYIVQRVLGQGGFGRSYLVQDSQRFGEACVLKEFFPTKKSGDNLQKALDLFKREAKTLYQLDHPQVPKFLACFTQKNRLFIVQEYIDGVPYSQLIKQRRQQQSQFSEAEVIQWLMQMLQVLDYLHRLGIVHRDISPDNIMYCRDRNLPVLIDFGLVSDAITTLLSGDLEEGDEGHAPTMVGKFGYSPPEQIHLGQCFPGSDLYALGVTAIVLLTSRYPRDLIDQDSLEWRWQSYVSLSPTLEDILTQMVQQKPKARFQEVAEVVQRLTQLVDSNSSPISPLTDEPAWAQSVNRPDSPTVEEPSLADAKLYDRSFIETCRQELTRCIGPMASVVVEEMVDQYPQATPAEFVDILASQLSNGNQATDFVSRLQGAIAQDTSDVSSGVATLSKVDPPQAAANLSSAADHLSPAFLSRCRQNLTRCIGPMASYLVKDTLDDFPNLSAQELVTRLAAEIPDAQKAADFRQQMQ
ncbi:protein kinase [Nodosilinea sp. LEGE 07088]|uniref:protein kinase domain-containing protein n=1 Tax=Nodosilinea sp. LEGE 07088 TaxID=2777968 RepID=UPI00188008A7|nr:protein kinase [Nodosilinea sp. LEGE 07088]MBE9140120.1 protein kinase [Nodosilinea sp. LEGE 07088]